MKFGLKIWLTSDFHRLLQNLRRQELKRPTEARRIDVGGSILVLFLSHTSLSQSVEIEPFHFVMRGQT